jgi:hypothetical protein
VSRDRRSTPPRRSWLRFFRPRTAEGDPGERWAAEVLRPLRLQEAECDVVSRVMARIAAERGEWQAATAPSGIPSLAWASSLLLACASLAFLVSTALLLVGGGDEGARQVVLLGVSSWHVLAVFGRLLVDFGARVLALVLPILRALWALLEVGAPLLRGAGLLAATGGALSILFSAFVFASARKTAPRVNFQGGIR